MTWWIWTIIGVWLAGLLFGTFVITPLLYAPWTDKRPPCWHWMILLGWPLTVAVMFAAELLCRLLRMRIG